MSTGSPIPATGSPDTPQTPQQTAADRWAPKPPSSVAAQAAEAERLLQQQNAPAPAQPNGAPATPAPGMPGPQPAPVPPAADENVWEQRARSAQGRWEAAQATVQTQAERLEQMERELALLRAGGAEIAPPSQATLERLITEQEVADYGADLIDVVGRRAKEVYTPEFEQLARRLDQIEGRVNGVTTVVQKNETQGVWDVLYDAVPDWVTINHHPAFHQWLAERAPYSSNTKHELLSDAFSRHDAPTVLQIFQGFIAETTGAPPNQQPQPAPSPAPAQGNGDTGRPSLMDYAAPGRARSAPQALPPDKPIYTRAIMNAFYDALRRGAYRGREAEAQAIEMDIFRAQHEGRIQ